MVLNIKVDLGIDSTTLTDAQKAVIEQNAITAIEGAIEKIRLDSLLVIKPT